MDKFRKLLKSVPLFVIIVRSGRKLFRLLRTRFLSLRAPEGDFLMCNGIKVFCNFSDETYAWYDGNSSKLLLDQRVIATLFNQVKGNVFLDIGAHFGFFSAYLAKLIQQERIHNSILISLEPDKNHFRCLEKTMKNYGGMQINLLPLAISSEVEDLTLYKTEASCLHTYREDGALSQYSMPAISLDSLVADHLHPEDKIALIKIDVDGAEPSLFYGGKNVLANHNPIIFMEFSPVHLKGFGVSPKLFFKDICQGYIVYWVCYQRNQIKRVDASDYNEIVSIIGKGVTDLVVADAELVLENTFA